MKRRQLLTKLVLGTALCFSLWGTPARAQQKGLGDPSASALEFALIGDIPYTAEQEPKYLNVIKSINRNKLAFTIHDGDFKSGSTLCSDQIFEQRYQEFQRFKDPFVFVFGDNEWTDCHRANNGGYDPLERLEALRQRFTQGDQSLGRRTLTLTRQSNDPRFAKFRENVRWSAGDVLFVGLNIPGSNNNFGRTLSADAEYVERNAANLVWMAEAFDLAKAQNARAVLLVIQANPGFELPPNHPERTGFNDFLNALEQQTLSWAKPVVLVHGDSHNFRIDKPLLGSRSGRRLENFTRVETFGSPDVHWLRVTLDPDDPNVFRFRQEIVPENLVNHQP